MKKIKQWGIIASASLFLLAGCQKTVEVKQEENFPCAQYAREEKPSKDEVLRDPVKADHEALSAYHAVYEIFVGSFNDTNGDGIGDLNGITEKLEYIKELGFDAIWLTPIHPSPTYHKYDVKDYRAIDPQFGTMTDYERLIQEAHKHEIKILQDLVINHVSVEHQWFQDVLKNGKKSPYCSYFMLKQDGANYQGDADKWYPVGKDNLKYYASFWEGMPELRLTHREVLNTVKENIGFWQDKGVDGFRLDAVGVFFNPGEYPNEYGANVYDMVNTVKQLHTSALTKNKGTYFVTEAWDAANFIAPLYAATDSSFNFELGKGMMGSVRGTLAKDYKEAYLKSHTEYQRAFSEYTDAIFLTNHDQNRVASYLPTQEEQKLAASILLMSPGIPYVYYGEEIAMQGVKPDELIREPMKWTDTQMTNPGIWKNGLKYNRETVSVERQKQDPNSLWNHYKKMNDVRKRLGNIQNARISFIDIDPKVIAYTMNQTLVLHNLSPETKTLRFAELSKVKSVLVGPTLRDGQITLPARTTFVAEIQK